MTGSAPGPDALASVRDTHATAGSGAFESELIETETGPADDDESNPAAPDSVVPQTPEVLTVEIEEPPAEPRWST